MPRGLPRGCLLQIPLQGNGPEFLDGQQVFFSADSLFGFDQIGEADQPAGFSCYRNRFRVCL
jgi:hypothetical protein